MTTNIGTASGVNAFDSLVSQYNQCGPAMWNDVFRCETWWDKVTDSSIANELIKCNHPVYLNTMKDPVWFCGYQYNQRLASSQMSVCTRELRARHMCYTNDEIDMHQLDDLCKDPGIVSKRGELSAKKFAEIMNTKVMAHVDAETPTCNTGTFIGKGINLGTVTNPFPFNVTTAMRYFGEWQAAYDTRRAPKGQRVMVMNSRLKSVIMASDAVQRSIIGTGINMALNGLCESPTRIGCDMIVFDECGGPQLAPIRDDVRLGWIYPVYGWAIDAISAAMGKGASRTVTAVEYDKMYFRDYAFYGIVTKRPELLFKGAVFLADTWINDKNCIV